MKRDMDLIRAILLELEDSPPGEGKVRSPALAERLHKDERTVGEHLRLMGDAGLVTITDFPESPRSECWVTGRGITWEGHEFLEAIRSDSVWPTVKAKLATVGGGASIAVVKAIAVQVVKEKLGLGD